MMQKLLKIMLIMFLLFQISGCIPRQNYCATNQNNWLSSDNNFCLQEQNANLSGESYRVYGKTYRVLASSTNYEETGKASWYGARFNRRKTYSGERFNMHSMTAAHKTLPMKTRLVVTNLLNGKQVIVRVNDRGPFVGNRLIDLSYLAAKKLGMIGHGVVPVNVKAIQA